MTGFNYALHFVCRGNMYRSRLAEAYTRTIELPGCRVSSSGIEANRYYASQPADFLEPHTKAAAENIGVLPKLAAHRQQTTNALLDEADIIVFMNKDVYRDACKHFVFNPLKAVIWDIADTRGLPHVKALERNIRRNSLRIPQYCRALAHELGHIGWVDIVSNQNQPLGFKLPLSWANRRHQWFRGCHVVLTTPAGKYLVEKRSATIIFSPGQLDISLGGAVDAGEQPLHAAVRETREEVGLVLAPPDLRLIDVRKQSRWHPRYHVQTRVFLYSYHAILDGEAPAITLQRKEVAAVRLLNNQQLTTLLRRHRLLRLGRLKYGYRYYQDIVSAVQDMHTRRLEHP